MSSRATRKTSAGGSNHAALSAKETRMTTMTNDRLATEWGFGQGDEIVSGLSRGPESTVW
jgi:hypothetical protein